MRFESGKVIERGLSANILTDGGLVERALCVESRNARQNPRN